MARAAAPMFRGLRGLTITITRSFRRRSSRSCSFEERGNPFILLERACAAPSHPNQQKKGRAVSGTPFSPLSSLRLPQLAYINSIYRWPPCPPPPPECPPPPLECPPPPAAPEGCPPPPPLTWPPPPLPAWRPPVPRARPPAAVAATIRRTRSTGIRRTAHDGLPHIEPASAAVAARAVPARTHRISRRCGAVPVAAASATLRRPAHRPAFHRSAL